MVVEGESFNFGSGRSGRVYTLQKLGKEMDFEVSIIKARDIKLTTGQTVTISSTVTRDLLASGRVEDAAVVLGRPYRLIGQIVTGKGKGRELGFPTANLQPAEQLVPAGGVYAGTVEISDSAGKVCKANQNLPAVFSISRPSIYSSENCQLIEAHLLEENVGKLYGKWMDMDFVKRIRDQRKFKTASDLSAQIARDLKKAKQILATN